MLSILFFIACRERCNSRLLERKFIDENSKSYLGFGKGSYWIFQNHDQSQTDSLYVVHYSYYWQKDNILCRATETITTNLKSSGKNLILSDSVCLRLAESINFKACEYSMFFENYAYLGSIPNSLANVVLNGVDYMDVFDLQQADYSPYHLYLKKDTGIIGWITPVDTFNLVRHYIVR